MPTYDILALLLRPNVLKKSRFVGRFRCSLSITR